MSRAGAVTIALVACLSLLAACSGGGDTPSRPSSPSPTASSSASAATASCSDVSSRLVAAVQRYVDGYGASMRSSGAADEQSAAPGNEDLQQVLADSQADLREAGCDLDDFRSELEEGLQGVTARGPLAGAVLLRLRASMTGRAATTASTVTARPADDLAQMLAELAPDSVVRLAPGRHRLSQTLVVLQAVTIVGAGRNRTELVSNAAGSVLLVLTDGRVELRGLTARHSGRSAASVLLGGPTSSVVLDAARIADASGKNGQGGNGVLMTASRGQEQGRGTTLEVTGTEFRGNEAAGVLLTGGHRTSVRRSTFVGNGQCGVCFADSSGGAVRTSRFSGNDVGVAVLDAARPALLDDRFTGGQVGVQASGRSRPLVRSSSVQGAARAAMIFSGRATGRVDGSTCTEVPYGIVVAGSALPFVGKNDCTIARSP